MAARYVKTSRLPEMDAIRTLVDSEEHGAGPSLPAELRQLYGGDLRFPSAKSDRPYVISNFVSTLDGVVTYRIEGKAGGATISGSDQTDRIIMALLRAAVDAVVVGSNTVHDVGPRAMWIPSGTWPEGKDLLNKYRVDVLHKPELPLVVIVSGSGRLDLNRAVYRTPRTVIVTTAAGREHLLKAGVERYQSVTVVVLPDVGGKLTPEAILRMLQDQFGAKIVLHEGGPTLLGEFLAEGLVDELFLTIAPQISGRLTHTVRAGLVMGVEFMPETAPWLELVSVKQKAGYLYLRYQVGAPRKPGG
ncbi:MAG TPA: dihydrofolate reductase family protein [Terriglobales bacterium]|nr:dihydrofolate reductase family protein [Terriglobales bacterium]